MTFPYTPLQVAVRHVEEEGPLADDLGGLPVVCCSLHSQVAPCAPRSARRPWSRTSSSRGGRSLSLALGRRARAEGAGLVEIAVAVAPCLDGDVQT